MCKLRIKGKYHNLSLICVHAPTEDSDNTVKKQFFEDLQRIQNRIPKHDATVLLRDMNAKIVLDAYSSVTGKYFLHKESNGNDELTCEYAAANDMYIKSTKFNHKKIYKGTWVAPDGNTCNQIDHVLVNQNKSSMIQEVRTLRRPSCNSDH